MTATQPSMPRDTDCERLGAPRPVEPILPTLTEAIADELRAEGVDVVVLLTDDNAALTAEFDGRSAGLDLYFDEGDSLIARVSTGDAGFMDVEYINSPDSGIVRDVLARLAAGS